MPRKRRVRKKPALPVYLTTAEVAAILGWSQRRARRWLENEDALVWRAGHLVTTRHRLREAFPEIYDEIVQALDST